ncbi:MAG TPA: hypothetical protein VMY35_06415 [Phycisphaerae bacterium]|nr:hypothetical protein [Phycisphaerae bacterium]
MTRPLVIRSRQEANRLIADIRSAVRRSARNGGGYGVYRRADDGCLAVNITVEIAQQARPRRVAEPALPSLQTA